MIPLEDTAALRFSNAGWGIYSVVVTLTHGERPARVSLGRFPSLALCRKVAEQYADDQPAIYRKTANGWEKEELS
jgi:hypothetical protein